MSLRSSARVQARQNSGINGINSNDAAQPAEPAKKRARKAKATSSSNAQDESSNAVQAGQPSSMAPPSTPNKRRRVAKSDAKPPPPPLTPTPSVVKLMASTSDMKPKTKWSSGDITDDTPPPENRPAEPHHTNAMLITPSGTQVQSAFAETGHETPSKQPNTQATAATTTTNRFLEDAKAHLLKVDPKLSTLINQHYCKVFSPEGLAEEIDPFRSLTLGILSQQISGAAAKSIRNKFIALFDADQCLAGFPLPSVVSVTPIARLREAGLSQRKAEYIQGLAENFHTGELSAALLLNGSDEDVMEKLVAVRGLGVWSVEMFMCFALKRGDIFSVGDLGVQRGLAAYLGRDVNKLRNKGGKWKYVTEKEMLEASEPFRPYRSLFMWYLWRYSDADVAALAGVQ